MSLEAKLEKIDEHAKSELIKLAGQTFEEYTDRGETLSFGLRDPRLYSPLPSYASVTSVRKGMDSTTLTLRIDKFPRPIEGLDKDDLRYQSRTFEAPYRMASLTIKGGEVIYTLFKKEGAVAFEANMAASDGVRDYFANLREGKRIIVGVHSPFLGRDEKRLAYVLHPEREDLVRIVDEAQDDNVGKQQKITDVTRAVELLKGQGYVVPNMNLGADIGEKEIRRLSSVGYLPELAHPRTWGNKHPEYAVVGGTTKGLMLAYIASTPRDTIRTQLVLRRIARI